MLYFGCIAADEELLLLLATAGILDHHLIGFAQYSYQVVRLDFCCFLTDCSLFEFEFQRGYLGLEFCDKLLILFMHEQIGLYFACDFCFFGVELLLIFFDFGC